MAPWDSSPLADLNGRATTGLPAGLVTPSKPTVVNGDDVNGWTIGATEANKIRQKLLVDLPEQRRRATAAEDKVASQEKLIQELQKALSDHQGAKERKRLTSVPEKKEEKTLELAHLRVELHQAQSLLESKDSTIERLLPEVVNVRMQDSEQVRSKQAEIERLRRELDSARAEIAQFGRAPDPQEVMCLEVEIERIRRELDSSRAEVAQLGRKRDPERAIEQELEIERLRRELGSTRAEVAQLKPELREAQERLDTKEAELDCLIPKLVASRTSQGSRRSLHSKDAELADIRQELEYARAELAEKNVELQQARGKHLDLQHARGNHVELQQARQDLEFKNDEIDQMRRELISVRAELSAARAALTGKQQEFYQGRSTNLELQQAQQDMEYKNSDNERLRHELDASRAQCSQYLIELGHLRREPVQSERRAASSNVDFLAQEQQQIARRSMDLERREQAVAQSEGLLDCLERREATKSEGLLVRSFVEPVVLPMRSPPVSRAPTPVGIRTASSGPTPPMTPPRQFYGCGGSGIPCQRGGGLLDRLRF